MKINKSIIQSLICISILMAMVIFEPNQVFQIVGFVIAVSLFAISEIDDEISVIFFSVNLIAALDINFFGIPLVSIFEAIFIIKCLFFFKTNRGNDKRTIIIIGLFLLSVISSIVLGFSVNRCFAFVINLLMMHLIFGFAEELPNDRKEFLMAKFFCSFVFGFAFTIVVSLTRTDISKFTYYNRFTALWTDPNFVGLFVLVSVCMLISVFWKKISRILFFIPLIALFLYCGYITYSRTFAIATFVAILCIMLAIIKSTKSGLAIKILGVIIVVIAGYLIYRYYLSNIFETRGIIEDSSGRDATNGRIDDWGIAWNIYISDWTHVVFGIGNNTSHNTIIDLLIKYGPVSGILFLILIISIFSDIRNLKVKEGLNMPMYNKILYIVLIIYLFTLPMAEDDFTYIIIGCLPLGLIKPNEQVQLKE